MATWPTSTVYDELYDEPVTAIIAVTARTARPT